MQFGSTSSTRTTTPATALVFHHIPSCLYRFQSLCPHKRGGGEATMVIFVEVSTLVHWTGSYLRFSAMWCGRGRSGPLSFSGGDLVVAPTVAWFLSFCACATSFCVCEQSYCWAVWIFLSQTEGHVDVHVPPKKCVSIPCATMLCLHVCKIYTMSFAIPRGKDCRWLWEAAHLGRESRVAD